MVTCTNNSKGKLPFLGYLVRFPKTPNLVTEEETTYICHAAGSDTQKQEDLVVEEEGEKETLSFIKQCAKQTNKQITHIQLFKKLRACEEKWKSLCIKCPFELGVAVQA